MRSAHLLPTGRGEPQHFQFLICRCSAVFWPWANSSKVVKNFFHFMHGVVCWNLWGRQECSHITSSSDRALRHLLNMSDDCEEASQNQPMFFCDFFSPSVNQLQDSHCEVLRGKAQRCLEAAFKTANDNELSQEPSGVGLCCHAGCFYWNWSRSCKCQEFVCQMEYYLSAKPANVMAVIGRGS